MGCRGTARSSEITRSESEYSPQQDEEARDSPAEPRNVTGSHEIGLILSARPTIGHGPSNHDSDVKSLNYFETGSLVEESWAAGFGMSAAFMRGTDLIGLPQW